MTTPDPQWTVEFSVYNNKNASKREVRIDAPELPDAVAGAVAGIQAIFGSEIARAVDSFNLKAFGDFVDGDDRGNP